MRLSSPAFEHEGAIPAKYTCDGEQFLSPPLEIDGVPEKALSLALIMDDPDVPKEVREDGLFTHWVVFDIPPRTVSVSEGENPGTLGANTRGEMRYTGPCPPPDYEPSEHRYFFKLYALDMKLELPLGSPRSAVERCLSAHQLAYAELMGRYKRTGA
ncbi:MAG TPA: YbhB/YbcL family Raf kinase inhibitor-like protein [Candidatus Paceibacterota bacterium]|nr:YbhB/YbcL family Raf kinase inhibitor-like protein [Candidatus Paceibacterota bacterium]